jgi:zinc protease
MTQQPPPAPPRQTSLGLELTELSISNGLRVVLVHDPRAAEVQVTMRYGVGAVDDPADAQGMAHLVEHLMFQQVMGTESVFAHLEDLTTYFNGKTSWDATTYVARAQPAHLAQLLEIEAVRLASRCATITDSAFVREREVVLNEARERGDAEAMRDAIDAGVFPAGHPYRRSRTGTQQSVGAITRDQACAFADAHYAPSNAVLVVSGNLTVDQLEGALGPFTHIDRRAAAVSAPVPSVAGGRQVEVQAPIDRDALLVAWPLPSDPALRIAVRAVVAAAAQRIDLSIAGQVSQIALGDVRAPVIGLYIAPGPHESYHSVLKATRGALATIPASLDLGGPFGELAFDRVQQSAIYKMFAGLQDGGERDSRIASDVLAGRDPHEVLGHEFDELRTMTRQQVTQVARDELVFDRAIVVHLVAHDDVRRGHPVAPVLPIHDLGERRDPPDPAAAHVPFAGELAMGAFEGIRMRRLPNGLHVVLLPLTTVPTLDIRLVFGAGTADEPPSARGAALLAAHTLTWDLQYLNDLMRFAAAGGTSQVDVDQDSTTFEARGLDMDLDLLLAGLRRWVRDGKYDDSSDAVAEAMRRAAKGTDDAGALTDAWCAALFGAGHPYVDAGLVRHASNVLGGDDAARFRDAYFTPDNATLVIAGRFDPELAEQWIDYLFADWTGKAAPRAAPPTHLVPVSLARVDDTAQVELRVALAADAGDRARRLVAAAMLDEVTAKVRHQLGASYDLGAGLAEWRLGDVYAINGWIEAPRIADAMQLLRTQLAQLRSDPAAAASAFVVARTHVIDQLLASSGSAAALAERVARDVELQRSPLSDLATARAVEHLTIDDMAGVLANLDLARAAVRLRGPADAINAGFGVLGRTPTYVHAPAADAEDPNARPIRTAHSSHTDDASSLFEFAPALTGDGPALPRSLSLTVGYASAQVDNHGTAGMTVTGELVKRFSHTDAAGLQVSIGYVGGGYVDGFAILHHHSVGDVPIDLAGVAQATAADRLWGALSLGLHLDDLSEDGHAAWHAGIGAGLEAGVDLVTRAPHRFGVFVRVQTELAVATPTVAFTGGLAYRR